MSAQFKTSTSVSCRTYLSRGLHRLRCGGGCCPLCQQVGLQDCGVSLLQVRQADGRRVHRDTWEGDTVRLEALALCALRCLLPSQGWCGARWGRSRGWGGLLWLQLVAPHIEHDFRGARRQGAAAALPQAVQQRAEVALHHRGRLLQLLDCHGSLRRRPCGSAAGDHDQGCLRRPHLRRLLLRVVEALLAASFAGSHRRGVVGHPGRRAARRANAGAVVLALLAAARVLCLTFALRRVLAPVLDSEGRARGAGCTHLEGLGNGLWQCNGNAHGVLGLRLQVADLMHDVGSGTNARQALLTRPTDVTVRAAYDRNCEVQLLAGTAAQGLKTCPAAPARGPKGELHGAFPHLKQSHLQ
mmetsp:Transcript_54611/g.175139  ORF Transcript_54611/g.175139 Transcript_54611/m.175139 type:complete len:356 (+) Transcript_54611:35-1102(+)